MATCHVFAGTHKAGSTAVQHFLDRNRRVLQSSGVHVVEAGHAASGHKNLAQALSAPEPGVIVREFAAELANQHGDVVLASELFGDVIDKAPMPNALLAQLETARMRGRFVLFIRPQAGYLNSRYAQLVKQLNCNLDFADFVETQLTVHRFNYDAHFSWMVDDKRFDTHFEPYNEALIARGVVSTVVDLLGLPEIAVKDKARANQIPGPKTIDALLDIQRREPEIASMVASERRALAMQINADAAAQGWNEERFDGLTESLRTKIESHFAASNDVFARKAWKKPWVELFG